MFYDAHTHLNSPNLFHKYDYLLKNFLNNGGQKLVNIGVDYQRNKRAIQIHKHYPNYCLATAGFHPSEVIIKNKNNLYKFNEKYLPWQDYLNKVEDHIISVIKNKLITGIGECGLDYHYKFSEEIRKKQKELFWLQCSIANKYQIPLIIHSRDAFQDTIEILQNFNNLKLYFHCWGYGEEEIKMILKLFPNSFIGFAGNITYKPANNLRDSIKKLPLDFILLETDAPYLTPQIIRKEQNQPANIVYTYEYVASLLNISLNTLKLKIEKNFLEFYNIK